MPVGTALTGIGALFPQGETAKPFVPAPSELSRRSSRRDAAHRAKHRARQARIAAIRRMKRARAERAARIRRARAELAAMERRGQEFCLATAVYFEARDEPLKGQRAVAAVILARTKTPGRPKTVCGVVYEGAWRKTGCQFSFACDGRVDVPRWPERWARAKRSAAYVWRNQKRTRSIVRGATFYHATYVRPRWSRYMIRVAKIGLHIFYRPRPGRYS
jgi:spore germination cell wall hydrolase CwlJ-like protein